MRELERENSVLYGYTPAIMQDIVNLTLIYDKIYDYEGSLGFFKIGANNLAQHLSGNKLSHEDIKGWGLSDTFILVNSIAQYHGFSLINGLELDPGLEKRLVWLDYAYSSRKADCKRFLNYIDKYFQLILKNAPSVAEKVVEDLSNLSSLFDEGIIIPRESILQEAIKEREATSKMTKIATDLDMEDKDFLSLVSWMKEDNQWWTSFTLNGNLLSSAYLVIPLHLWEYDLPLIEYKYRRGARYLPEIRKTEIIKEAFSMIIPEMYSLGIPELLAVRNSSEYRNLRGEVLRIYKHILENPQDFPDPNTASDYLKNNYISQIEKIALERRPNPNVMIVKKLVSIVHPIVGLMVGGAELYKELKDKYQNWRFAVSVLDVKGKIRSRKRAL